MKPEFNNEMKNASKKNMHLGYTQLHTRPDITCNCLTSFDHNIHCVHNIWSSEVERWCFR